MTRDKLFKYRFIINIVYTFNYEIKNLALFGPYGGKGAGFYTVSVRYELGGSAGTECGCF